MFLSFKLNCYYNLNFFNNYSMVHYNIFFSNIGLTFYVCLFTYYKYNLKTKYFNLNFLKTSMPNPRIRFSCITGISIFNYIKHKKPIRPE